MASIGKSTLTAPVNSASTLIVNLPSPLVPGTLLTVLVFTVQAQNVTLPSTWNFILQNRDANNVTYCAVFTRLCDGTEGTTVTATAASSTEIGAASFEVVGAIDIHKTSFNSGISGSNVSMSCSTVNSDTPNVLVLYAGVARNATTVTAPVNSLTGASGGSASNDMTFRANYLDVFGKGATPTNSFVSNSTTNTEFTTVTIAFQPSTVGILQVTSGTSQPAANTTTLAVTIPTPILVDSYVVVGIQSVIAATMTSVDPNWVKYLDVSDGFASANLALFVRRMNGTESATVNFTASTAQQFNYFTFRVTGVTGILGTASNSSTGGTNTLIGPTNSLSWADVVTFYFAITNDATDVTIPPSRLLKTINPDPGTGGTDLYAVNYAITSIGGIQPLNNFVRTTGNSSRAWLTASLSFTIASVAGTAAPSTRQLRPRGGIYLRGGDHATNPVTGIGNRGSFESALNSQAVWGPVPFVVFPNNSLANPLYFAGRF